MEIPWISFCVTYHSGLEWNRRITNEKSGAISFVSKQGDGCKVNYLKVKGAFCPPRFIGWFLFMFILFGIRFIMAEDASGWKTTLLLSLITTLVFAVDGNKRIGVYIMVTFLKVNGIYMDCTNEELTEVGMKVADGSMDYEALLAWVRDHRS